MPHLTADRAPGPGAAGDLPLRVTVVPRDGARRDRRGPVAVQVVRVVGDVDIATVTVLADAMADALTRAFASRGHRVVVGTTEMDFCGVVGLRLLMCATRFAVEFGVVFAHAGLSPRLEQLSAYLWPDDAVATVYRDRAIAILAVGLGSPWPGTPGPGRPSRPPRPDSPSLGPLLGPVPRPV